MSGEPRSFRINARGEIANRVSQIVRWPATGVEDPPAPAHRRERSGPVTRVPGTCRPLRRSDPDNISPLAGSCRGRVSRSQSSSQVVAAATENHNRDGHLRQRGGTNAVRCGRDMAPCGGRCSIYNSIYDGFGGRPSGYSPDKWAVQQGDGVHLAPAMNCRVTQPSELRYSLLMQLKDKSFRRKHPVETPECQNVSVGRALDLWSARSTTNAPAARLFPLAAAAAGAHRSHCQRGSAECNRRFGRQGV